MKKILSVLLLMGPLSFAGGPIEQKIFESSSRGFTADYNPIALVTRNCNVHKLKNKLMERCQRQFDECLLLQASSFRNNRWDPFQGDSTHTKCVVRILGENY